MGCTPRQTHRTMDKENVTIDSKETLSSSKEKRGRDGKQKKRQKTSQPQSPEPVASEDIAHILDHSRYFSKQKQMTSYADDFLLRDLVHPKIMDFDYFVTSGLQFQELLSVQGLDAFVSLEDTYYPNLIKVFYANLTILDNGDLCSEVCKVKIRVKPRDWLAIANLKYEGQKFQLSKLPDNIGFHRGQALDAMVRPDLQGRNCKNTGSLTIEDRLLHYAFVHILMPRGSNYALVLMEDIFILWAIKQRIQINWPYLICQHMKKCKVNGMPLPYGLLITKIMEFHRIHLGAENESLPGWSNRFNQKSLKKLKVIQVDGVWQHSDQNMSMPMEHGEEDGDSESAEKPQGSQPQAPQVTPDSDMLNQFFSSIQGLQDGLNRLTDIVREEFQRVDKRFDDFDKRFEDLHNLYQQGPSQ
ncbi:hypothetical protein AAZX31_17G239300 [Glycine max]|nr:hypothetical protein D0Y65_046970 [Glycine soja]